MGAPITMARDMQAEAGVGHADGFIEALEAQEERWTLSNGDTLLREPIGPAGLITPWNWPINQIALKVLAGARDRMPRDPETVRAHAAFCRSTPKSCTRRACRRVPSPSSTARAPRWATRSPASGPRHGVVHRIDARGHLGQQIRGRQRQARHA
jgi:hypothetical protein